jgi:DNA-binding CsgD family transcriptional regulator
MAQQGADTPITLDDEDRGWELPFVLQTAPLILRRGFEDTPNVGERRSVANRASAPRGTSVATMFFAMSVHLSDREIEGIQALSRLMVSAPGSWSRQEWLGRIDEGLMRLTGAERALAGLPMRDPSAVVVRGFDPAVVEAFLKGPVDEDSALALVMATRPSVVHQRMVYGEDLERLPLFQEFLRPWGIVNSAAMHVFLPDGALALAGVMTGDTVDVEFQRRSHALLELLQPSFQAGVEGWIRVHRLGPAMGRLLDAVSDAMALCSRSGRLLHANRSLSELLAADPEAKAVVSAASAIAVRFSAPPDRKRGLEVGMDSSTECRTHHQAYRLAPTAVGEEVSGDRPAVLVRVTPLDGPRARADLLMTRYGLTDRESEVALHLARGESDREIAERLMISWHTVRTHVERVLGKLGVDSRSKVSPLLRP